MKVGGNLVDVSAIQSRLKEDPQLIIDILEDLGYSPKDCGSYLKFANLDGDNKGACTLYKDSLRYCNYTRANRDGDIFTLIMHDKLYDFHKAIMYAAKMVGYEQVEDVHVTLPFGGFFKNIQTKNKGTHIKIPVYNADTFKMYEHKYNKKFFKDGVDYLTQEVFNLGYNKVSNAIMIPMYTPSGQLCGIKARNNDPNCLDDHRWWAQVPFPKTALLYGYHINYLQIVQTGTLIIVEAEKSVMQSYSFGVQNVLAVLGHNISKEQVRLIKSMHLKQIIVAFDEGVAESDILLEALKLKQDDVQIGYVYDKNHDILMKGSKNSPCDVGEKNFKKLTTDYVTWLKLGGDEDEC